MKNAFSVDLEDWFCVHNFAGVIPFSEWSSLESRIERNTNRLLSIFDKHTVKATFFVLGWIAEKKPSLVTTIAAEGHEIASHGYAHLLATEVTADEFEKDLVRSLEILKSMVSQKIIGFRAPSFTVTRKTLWLFEILTRHGILYDSSLFPIGFHPDYGISNAALSPFAVNESLTEFPLGCFRFLNQTIPCCGGGWFRIFPYAATRYGLRQSNRDNRPAVFYVHPWEIDAGQPRVKSISAFKRFRHYFNIGKTEERLHRLLDDFEFSTIDSVLKLR